MNPIKLLQESIGITVSVYRKLLILSSPNLIWVVLPLWTQSQSILIVSLVGLILIQPWVWGASTFCVYQYIQNKKSVSINIAVKQGIQRSPHIILGYVLYSLGLTIGFFLVFVLGLLLLAFLSSGLFPFNLIAIPILVSLIVFSIYLCIRLSFFSYPILIENRSVLQGFRCSWSLVKKYWWSASIALLGPYLIFEFFFYHRIERAMSGAENEIAYLLIARGLDFLVISPIDITYGALLFNQLQKISAYMITTHLPRA